MQNFAHFNERKLKFRTSKFGQDLAVFFQMGTKDDEDLKRDHPVNGSDNGEMRRSDFCAGFRCGFKMRLMRGNRKIVLLLWKDERENSLQILAAWCGSIFSNIVGSFAVVKRGKVGNIC